MYRSWIILLMITIMSFLAEPATSSIISEKLADLEESLKCEIIEVVAVSCTDNICHIYMNTSVFEERGKVYILRVKYLPSICVRGFLTAYDVLLGRDPWPIDPYYRPKLKSIYYEFRYLNNSYAVWDTLSENEVVTYSTPPLMKIVSEKLSNIRVEYINIYNNSVVSIDITSKRVLTTKESRLLKNVLEDAISKMPSINITSISKLIITYYPQDREVIARDFEVLGRFLEENNYSVHNGVMGAGRGLEYLLPSVDILSNSSIIDEVIEGLNRVIEGRVIVFIGDIWLEAEPAVLRKTHWEILVLVGVVATILLTVLYKYSKQEETS